MEDSRTAEVARLLTLEAALLDEHRWDEWLELMAPEVEYWIPAWDRGEPTSDPDSELSLIYYNSRQGLEDRVFRIRSGRSVASEPLPRTCHYVSNLRCEFQPDGHCQAFANWQVNSWRDGRTNLLWGRYEYHLEPRQTPARWQIRKKKILLMNDAISTVLDVYLV